jgi:serine/threonine protein kinase
VFFTVPLRWMRGAELAIKKLDPDSMQGHTEFLQEVQVLGACRHQNLTPLLGFAADTGGVCLVTPLMKGGSLEDRLIQDVTARQRLSKLPGAPAGGFEPLSWLERLTVAVDVVTGLLYLHTPDPDTHKPAILHRDIKPSNILLDLDNRARLADMGLSRAQRPGAAHLTTTTSIAGTIGYLDDYYQNGGRFDEKADGYAVGVTLLVLLMGRPAVVEGEHIIGRCDVEDVSEVADERAQWPSAVAEEVHKVGMDLVKQNRARRITLSTALHRLQQLVDAHPAPALEPEVVVERECMMCLSAPRHVRFGW